MSFRLLKILLGIQIFLFLSPCITLSQVVVERSKDKVIISGKPYYIHIVKKGETAYSISKAYYITVDDLVRENPAASNGIREGQSLKIPVVDTPPRQKAPPQIQVQRDETKYIYHKLTTGDTVYSLARKFGVSEDEILQSNPGVEINKLPVGAEIAIPRREFTTNTQKLDVTEKEYITHRVEKGESLASIAQKYGITVRELRKENRGLLFPKVDDFVKVPVSKVVETVKEEELHVADTLAVKENVPEETSEKPVGYTAIGELRGKYNIALLLPLYYYENSKRTQIDSSKIVHGKPVYKVIKRPDQWIYPGTDGEPGSLPFLELYQGVLLAADTLRSRGLDIDIRVFDIRRDSMDVIRLIESGKLSDADLIIGPVYSHNLSIVARYANEKEIPVISPVPLKSNAILNNNPMLFMANPSLQVAQEVISKRISENYTSNFVFIHSDTARTDPSVAEFKSMIFRELSSKVPLDEIRFKELLFFSRSLLSNDSINRLEHALSDKTDNLVLIASEEPPVLSETIMDLHTLSKKYQLKLIGYPAMRELKNLEPKYYFDLGIELYSPYWIDYSKTNVKKFILSYRRKFLTEPSEDSYAWQGYDIAYYFISGLAVHGKRFISKPEIHNPRLLETEFDFLRTGEGAGFENHKLYLIKYTGDMEVKMLENNDIDMNNKN